MKITIAICTKDRPQFLKKNLKHLFKQTPNNKKQWEFLIIDNSSSKLTEKIVTDFNCQHPSVNINYFYEKRKGISFVRNTAIKKAKTDLVAFIDDDVFINDDWFRQLKIVVKKFPQAALIGGRIFPLDPLPKDKKWLSNLIKNKRDFWPLALLDKGHDARILKKGEYGLITANLIIRKKYFYLIGCFNQTFASQKGLLKIFGGEDVDFVKRAVDKGFEVVYWPKLVVFHKILPHKLTKKYFRWRYFENGKEMANLDLLHKGKNELFKKTIKLIRDIPLCLRRTFSQYLFNRPKNFYFEVSFFFTVGYFIFVIFFFVNNLIKWLKK